MRIYVGDCNCCGLAATRENVPLLVSQMLWGRVWLDPMSDGETRTAFGIGVEDGGAMGGKGRVDTMGTREEPVISNRIR